jgi:zinc metalloprotease ZmpB
MADEIIRNEYGEAVLLSNLTSKEGLESFGGATPVQVADNFIKNNLNELGLSQSRLEGDDSALESAVDPNDPIILFSHEKDISGSSVVVYDQFVMGLNIFDSRMGVSIDNSDIAVTSVQSSMHGQVSVANPEQYASGMEPKTLTLTALKKKLGIELEEMSDGRIERQVVYRFEPDERVEVIEDEHGSCFGGHAPPPPDLPPLPDGIEKGEHYIVDEVLFRAARQPGEPPVNWRALVEPATGAVLYIRALVAGAFGMVFAKDPQTQNGSVVNGTSTNAVLNPLRTTVSLSGILATTPQPLNGEYVELAETSAPVIAAPIVPNPAVAFNFDVRTDHFSAVNAYFHCDKLFRTMADFGFNVPNYFDGTTFPVPVDHRALGNAVNAQAPGNAAGNGLGELRFALLQAGEPIGIATSNRVVWHEFGHALLWDHVNSPNFGFAHSAGDSLASILNDPGSKASDRFDTFPWVQAGTPIGRRHDREVASGWAWFGPNYNTQYNGEMILSTTLFRLYRSLGGDSNTLATQTRAAETVAYLIFKAIGLLVATTQFPDVFVRKLQEADLTTPNFKGIAGGALHKVIRWTFEKQGLFQPGAQPGQGNGVMTEGNPPVVDVYIDDGRNGEYQYLANHWSCQDMWVRNSADGGMTHQNPLVGLTNYMYVRVKNRGLQAANGVYVDAYHCLPGTGLAFPDDWMAMATPSLPAAGPIPPGGSTIIGPFAFVPTQVNHECLLAIAHADDDPGNDTTITGTIPEHRFVPFDNNIGQRNVNPVFPSFKELLKLFRKHLLWVRNPFREVVVCRIEIELPRFLRRLGWEMRVLSAGGQKFELGQRERREIVFSLEPGEDFTPDMAHRAIAEGDNEIRISTYLNDDLSGGMSYLLSFESGNEDKPPEEDKPEEEPPIDRPTRPLTLEEVILILRENWPSSE